jgi:hypothetical protein
MENMTARPAVCDLVSATKTSVGFSRKFGMAILYKKLSKNREFNENRSNDSHRSLSLRISARLFHISLSNRVKTRYRRPEVNFVKKKCLNFVKVVIVTVMLYWQTFQPVFSTFRYKRHTKNTYTLRRRVSWKSCRKSDNFLWGVNESDSNNKTFCEKRPHW